MTGGKGYDICDINPNSAANKAIARFVHDAFAGLGSPARTPNVTVVRSDHPECLRRCPVRPRRHFLSSPGARRARSPDEFAGVLAHELGHVYYRHGMQTLIDNSTTGLLVGFVLGDMTGLSVAGAIGSSLVDNRFSRQAEAQADRFAGETAKRLGFSPKGLVDLLERVASDDEFSRALALFSNHPLTDQRNAGLEAIEGDTSPTEAKPAFTDAEWSAIRDMCPPPPPPPLPKLVGNALMLAFSFGPRNGPIWARRVGARWHCRLAAIPVLLHREHLITSDNFLVIEAVALSLAALAVLMAFIAFTRFWFTGDQLAGPRRASPSSSASICLAPAA